jgi:hypothetical protein
MPHQEEAWLQKLEKESSLQEEVKESSQRGLGFSQEAEKESTQ